MLTKEKSGRKSLIVGGATCEKGRHAQPQMVAVHPEDVRKYIAAMATQLAEMAYRSQLDALASACDVVREVAEGNVTSQSRHLDYRAGDAGGVNADQDDFPPQRASR